jgi:antitoxin (DNA-binding transcriptional repressor) of toxin-antitoxin stability system
MRQATLEEAARTLGELIEAVRAGETVVITEDGVAVAELTQPVRPATLSAEDEARLDRLERAGLLRRAERPPLAVEELPELVPLTGVLDALLEERREGR